MQQEFIRFIEDTAKAENRYIIIGGDLLENGTRHSVGDSVFTQTMPPNEQKMLACNLLEKVKDKVLCFVQGNHEKRSVRDTGTTCPLFDIACVLGKPELYRENIAFLDIQLGIEVRENGTRPAGNERPNYSIVVLHGSSNGMYAGSNLTRNERFAYVIDGMDALVTGHVHKPFMSAPQKIVIDRRNKKIDFVPFKTVSATSWLRYGGYAAQKMLLPYSHDLQTLTLSGKKKKMSVTM